MLSKKFFVEHANEHVKKMIRHKVRPYPIKNALQENLQNKVQLEVNLIDRFGISYSDYLSQCIIFW